jgi:hypothetical protein
MFATSFEKNGKKKYLHDEPLAIVKNGAKSSDSKVDDFLTLVHGN